MNSHESDSPITPVTPVTPGEPTEGNIAEREPSTMPLGVGNFDDDMAHDPLAMGAESHQRFKTGTLLIIAVILVSAGGLFFMRTLARKSFAQSNNAQIEGTVEEFFEKLKLAENDPAVTYPTDAAQDAEVIAVLTEDYQGIQVPLEQVQKDPFIIWASETVDEKTPNQIVVDPCLGREEQIVKASEGIELKMVLMGSRPLANLNDEIMEIGERIIVSPENIEFRVSEITPEGVKLVGLDEACELEVEINVDLRRE